MFRVLIFAGADLIGGVRETVPAGKRHREAASGSRSALHFDFAAVQPYVILGQHKSDAGPFGLLVGDVARLIEPFENACLLFAPDAAPGVADRNADVILPLLLRGLDAQGDPPAVGREFEGVGEQVVKYLLDFVAVEEHVDAEGVRLEGVFDASLPGVVAEGRVYLLPEGGDVAHAEAEFHLVVVDLAHVHDLVDQAQQPLGVLLHDQQHLALALRRRFEQRLDRAENQRQRGLEFMRDIGEEDHLGLIDLLVGLPAHDFEFKLPRQPDADAHQIDGQYAERREQQRIPDTGRGAAPPCGADDDVDLRRRFAPDVVRIRGVYAEGVTSRRNVRIGGVAVFAVGRDPLLVVSVELVGV